MIFLLVFLSFFSGEVFSSILGIDFGSSTYKMVLTPEGKRKIMQLMLNDQSSRKTESIISFRGEERLFGSMASNNMKFSPQTTYPYLRDLLGVRSVEIAKDRVGKYVGYADTLFETEGEYKQIGMKNPVTGTNFTVIELVAMQLQQAKRYAEKDSGSKILDLCITVPVYFTQAERQALIDAATVAGLSVVSLVDQGTALAVSYGIEQTFTPEDNRRNVIFFDFGESSLQLTLAHFSPTTEFKKNITQVQILASIWEPLGGRDFTEALVQHFLAEVKTKLNNPNLDRNPRVMAKLRGQLGKTKETLSASKETQFVLQSLDGDYDFSGSITRKQFEDLTEQFYPRIQSALERLMKMTNLTSSNIYAVEMIGGSSRIPRVHTVIREFFGKQQMDNHMNSDEAAVFGSAFFGAAYSGRYKTAGVKVRDITHRNITAFITTHDSGIIKEAEEIVNEGEKNSEVIQPSEPKINEIKVFLRGSSLTRKKTFSFYTSKPFQFELQYLQDEPLSMKLPKGAPYFIDLYNFTNIPVNKSQDSTEFIPNSYNLTSVPQIHLKIKLNPSGMVEVSAVAEIHYSEMQFNKKKKETPKVVDEKLEEKTTEEPNGEKTDASEKAETDEKTPEEPKTSSDEEKEKPEGDEKYKDILNKLKKEKNEEDEFVVTWVTKKKEVPLRFASQITLPSSIKDESVKILSDQDYAETLKLKNHKIKNDIESMVYEIKGKINDADLIKVTTEEQRESLLGALNYAAEWLEEEGADAILSVSREKLKALERVVNPILFRVSELKNFPIAAQNCSQLLEATEGVLKSIAETREVSEKEIADVLKDRDTITEWLAKELATHQELQPHQDSALSSTLITKKCSRIYSQFEKLSKKKKKQPKKPEPKKSEAPEQKSSESQEQAEPTEEDKKDL